MMTNQTKKREIKFRFWVEELSDWADGGCIYDDGSISCEKDDVGGYEGTPNQYTGLKDKNGKEIYEGDVLQYRDGLNTTGGYKEIAGGYYIVEWNTYKWKLRRTNLARSVQKINGIGPIHTRPRDWEVIGSIYKNPELLK